MVPLRGFPTGDTSDDTEFAKITDARNTVYAKFIHFQRLKLTLYSSEMLYKKDTNIFSRFVLSKQSDLAIQTDLWTGTHNFTDDPAGETNTR